jgi:hypothetical protein
MNNVGSNVYIKVMDKMWHTMYGDFHGIIYNKLSQEVQDKILQGVKYKVWRSPWNWIYSIK